MNGFPEKIGKFLDSKKGIFVSLLSLYLFAVFFTFFFITTTAYGPVHQGDENRYWEMALALTRGTFTLFEYHHSPLFYSLTLIPAFLFSYPSGTYVAAKFLNTLYITSVIFPSYLILRKFASRNFSLLVSAVILLNPAQVVFPRQTLSENVYYPLLLWGFLLATTNIFPTNTKKYSIENFVFGLILGALLLTRFISFAIIPVMLVIWWFKPHFDEKKPFLLSVSKFIQACIVVFPVLLILGIWIYLGSVEGLTIKQLLGFDIASNSNPLQLTISRLVMWTVLYGSYVILMAAPVIGILTISPLYIHWKDWRDDLPRLFIAVALVVIFFLIGSIRHSWRAAYNYPDPGQMMGRYVFFVGPLILIAAAAAISKVKLPNLQSKDWGYWLHVLIASTIIVTAYGIVYQGWFYLGHPAKISGTSTDDYLFTSLGSIFLPAVLFINMIIAWFMGRNQKKLLASFVIFLSIFYFVADVNLYQKRVLPQQFYTLQAYHFLKAAQNDGLLKADDPESVNIVVKTEPGVASEDDESLGKWLFTLRVYGFRNVSFEEDKRLSGDAEAYKFIKVGNTEYEVDGVNKPDYLSCNCEKYELLGKYYTVRQVQNKQ